MLKQLKNKEKGFTIIEVMIVLAIAGLILLIVFLAVPALQRNSRNTALKNDAAALAAGFSEYSSNNDGGQPASIAQSGSVVTVGATGSAQATAKVSSSTTVTVAKVTAAPTYTGGTLWWRTGITCDGATNSRAIIVYYGVETSSGGSIRCTDAG